MELTPLEKNDVVLFLLLFLLQQWPSNRALCFPPFFLTALLPSFSICPLPPGQKREVEVIYGYNPLCTAKKINLNEVIYYLWQVFCTQNCLSELVRIDFPYFRCQPLACHCSLEVNKQFKVAGFLCLGTWLQGLTCVCILGLRAFAFSCLTPPVGEESIPVVSGITQIRSKTYSILPFWKGF